jgi:membrane fusion protein, macrolide-specific efflux system
LTFHDLARQRNESTAAGLSIDATTRPRQERNAKRMKTVITGLVALVLVLVGLGVAGYAVLGSNSGGNTSTRYLTSQATQGTVAQTAAASGSLVSATTYELAFGETPTPIDNLATSTDSSSTTPTASDSITTWPVTVVNVLLGEVVHAGEVLATADTTSAELNLTKAQADLEAANQQLADDEAGGDANSQASARDSLTTAQRNLNDAKANLKTTKAQSALSLTQARRTLSDARQQLADDRDAGAPSSVKTQDKQAITQAEQGLKSTKLQTASNNRQAESQVASAQLALEAAQRGYTTATTSADAATIAADRVAISDAQDAVDNARAALDAATIRAPIDGRITAVNVKVGDDATGTAIELQSTQMAVTIAVGESDILSIKNGQTANVDVSATGGTATGKVISIDPVAATSGSSTSVSYNVTVLLDDTAGQPSPSGANPSPAASPAAADVAASTDPLAGMTADVTIVIAQADNAVAVPIAALSGTSGNYTVQVMGSDGTPQSRPVQVGLITSSLAQITSGITAGETVVTGTTADRTSTSAQNNGGFGQFGGGGFQPPAGGFPNGFPGGGTNP